MILDACCGDQEWWRGKDTSNVIFMDKLLSVRPSLVGSMCALPFRDSVFSQIWCDPPHLIRNDTKNWNPAYLRYGNWRNRREWEAALDAINEEFWRVAMPDAVLHMKIIDGKDYRVTKEEDLDRLSLWVQTAIERVKTPVPWSTNFTIYATYRRVTFAAERQAA